MLRCAVTAICIVVACGAAGCSSFTDQDSAACTTNDWDRFGENDGRLGVATQDRADLFERCDRLGAGVDLAAYQAGRSRGLEQYCTLSNGFDLGRSGRRYDGVCPPMLEADFLQGYDRGRAERPATSVLGPDVTVGVGIGIGSGGYRRGRVRTGIGVGIGLGHFGAGYGYRNRHW
ncbi:MAG: DUF2799 domain-containing protein [Pseudomonadota bacterium]